MFLEHEAAGGTYEIGGPQRENKPKELSQSYAKAEKELEKVSGQGAG